MDFTSLYKSKLTTPPAAVGRMLGVLSDGLRRR